MSPAADLAPCLQPRHWRHSPKNRHVLVVDDSRSMRATLESALQQAGYDVVVAENGQKALGLLQTLGFDLVISDVQMPEMGGLELRDQLLADPNLAHIPFIAISVHKDANTLRRLKSRSIAAFLIKPFHMDQLLILAEKFLSDYYALLRTEREKIAVERRMIVDTVMSLARALDARDSCTRHHSESVGRLALAMGRKLGLGGQELETLSTAARLHDIGKIAIPDSILQKPGPLTDAEYEIIKTHPTKGSEIISSVPSLSEVSAIVLAHHERMDGQGYPQNLRGEDIPFAARVVATADAFDALTSNRPYRTAFSRPEAMKVIKDVRGSQLCPRCVDALLEVVD